VAKAKTQRRNSIIRREEVEQAKLYESSITAQHQWQAKAGISDIERRSGRRRNLGVSSSGMAAAK